jgi:hypothetical protein
MNEDLKVIQFVHPGFEYSGRDYVGDRKERSGVMPWKDGGSIHNRKFMWSVGSAVDADSNQLHEGVGLTFWGEWEGPSVFWKVESPGKPVPSVVHAPFRPAECPTAPVQNTDPMVFGDAFIYSNCMQGQYKALQGAPPGSLILFGRYAREDGRPSFSLDTCLVVDRVQKLSTAPFDEVSYGEDLLDDVVLRALHSEGFKGELHIHFGRGREGGTPFSFFPAQIAQDEPALFARPELEPRGALEGVVSPGNMQGIKVTHGLTAAQRDAIWNEISEQVAGQGCALGYFAASPPLLQHEQVEAKTRSKPHLLSSVSVAR